MRQAHRLCPTFCHESPLFPHARTTAISGDTTLPDSDACPAGSWQIYHACANCSFSCPVPISHSCQWLLRSASSLHGGFKTHSQRIDVCTASAIPYMRMATIGDAGLRIRIIIIKWSVNAYIVQPDPLSALVRKSVLFYQITTIHAAFGTDKYVTLLIENLFPSSSTTRGRIHSFFRLSCPFTCVK